MNDTERKLAEAGYPSYRAHVLVGMEHYTGRIKDTAGIWPLPLRYQGPSAESAREYARREARKEAARMIRCAPIVGDYRVRCLGIALERLSD